MKHLRLNATNVTSILLAAQAGMPKSEKSFQRRSERRQGRRAKKADSS